MQLLVVSIFLAVPAYAFNRCAVVPPTLWCSSETVMKECGFKEFCDNYNAATYNQRVNLTIFSEGLCPMCNDWFTNYVYPKVYKNFADFINIEYVPYGNAQYKNGTITCQHGELECRINRYFSCIIDVMGKQDVYIPFLHCLDDLLIVRRVSG
ncbi:unnamed protein product [Strongylus vulgaris]|uniref:Saposin A-type domain-containing protein n=1 Tax=Strongylus vulgaris TaxID=40348 RepID=A0A3P7LH52_STRVU|nr:unnamed protein product [Strongylus vulgaris]